MPDDEIIRAKHIALFEYIMKHVKMRDTLKLLQNLLEKLPEAVKMDKERGYVCLKNVLWYVDGNLSIEKRNELSGLMLEHLPKNDGENIMQTIADSYREEGVNKGIAIGKSEGITIGEARGEAKGIEKRNVEIACRMLKEKTDIKFITSVTGLSIDEILKLQNSTQINQ
jgi:predicted transposase YdaD